MNAYFLLLIGLSFLILSGHFLLDSVSSIATRFRIKPLFVSIVILGFVTSSPEWFVSMLSACENLQFFGMSICKNNSNLAIGNVLGSNLANILLVLCLAGLIACIKNIDEQVSKLDLPFLLCVTLGLGLLFYDAHLGILDAFICLFLFVSYLIVIFKKRKNTQPDINPVILKMPIAILYLVGGFALLFLGSYLAVDSALDIVRQTSLSEKFAGIFILSVGTGLPELVTSISAALKKRTDMLVGGIIGSNIFNTLFIVGFIGFVKSSMISNDFRVDYIIGLAALLALCLTVWLFKKVHIVFCILGLLTYGIYIYFTAVGIL